MKRLAEYFKQAKAERWALGHFNFSTAEQLRAIIEAAIESGSPVMVATSEGEGQFFGYEQAAAVVEAWRRQSGHPIFLNADHHKSRESAIRALQAGYHTVLIDGSKLPLEDNISLTCQVKEVARKGDIPVEGELGYLRGESAVQTKVEISPADYTKPEEAAEFVRRTGVERLAVVFGNIHGITTEQEEHLDLAHLEKIAEAVPAAFLVLHGASGLQSGEIKEAVKRGIVNVHINTEIRVAFQQALRGQLAKEPDQTTPYKFLQPALEAVKTVVKEKLEILGSVGKI